MTPSRHDAALRLSAHELEAMIERAAEEGARPQSARRVAAETPLTREMRADSRTLKGSGVAGSP